MVHGHDEIDYLMITLLANECSPWSLLVVGLAGFEIQNCSTDQLEDLQSPYSLLRSPCRLSQLSPSTDILSVLLSDEDEILFVVIKPARHPNYDSKLWRIRRSLTSKYRCSEHLRMMV